MSEPEISSAENLRTISTERRENSEKNVCQTIKINERSELFVELTEHILHTSKKEQGFRIKVCSVWKLSSCALPRSDKQDWWLCWNLELGLELNRSHSRKNKRQKMSCQYLHGRNEIEFANILSVADSAGWVVPSKKFTTPRAGIHKPLRDIR